jgi:fused
MMTFLMNLSSKSDLSPTGFIALLQFIHDMIQQEQREFTLKIFKNCMKLLCSMMRDNQLLSVQEWPTKCGGGSATTELSIVLILKIFNIPFNQQVYDRDVDEISAGLAKADIIYLTLNALKYM